MGIVGANNEIMGQSELLENKQNCINAINVVEAEATDAPVRDSG